MSRDRRPVELGHHGDGLEGVHEDLNPRLSLVLCTAIICLVGDQEPSGVGERGCHRGSGRCCFLTSGGLSLGNESS